MFTTFFSLYWFFRIYIIQIRITFHFWHRKQRNTALTKKNPKTKQNKTHKPWRHSESCFKFSFQFLHNASAMSLWFYTYVCSLCPLWDWKKQTGVFLNIPKSKTSPNSIGVSIRFLDCLLFQPTPVKVRQTRNSLLHLPSIVFRTKLLTLLAKC